MVYLAGIVLLILVTFDLTLGQRKHGRTLPVAADVKTSLNFDCPEEFGYYPHPGDCTQYYVCVFGGALLESCTGGLMYSHELQTCDWPRNVGCDVAPESATTPSATYSSSSSVRVPETKVRYTHPPPPPPPAQPAAVVTSRGQPRQLQRNEQDLIKQKQQQQLYVDAEDALPPAEEIENDRQQRVYRGQPSTIGQVQKDRDGLRHHTNSIPSSSNGVEKIGVISFGTQQGYHDYRDMTDVDNFLTNDMTLKRQKRQTKSRVENLSNRPVEQSYSTSRPRQTYNSSQQYDSSRYDPYYDLYEEIDPDLYKNVEYTQNYNNEPPTSQKTYKSSTSSSQVLIQDNKAPKRGNAAYNQNSYSTSQDVYRPQTYKENSYSQEEDQGIYQQTSKQSFRGDQNELNYIEEATTSKRVNSIKTTVPTPRQFSTQKNRASSRLPNSAHSNEVQTASSHLQLIESPGYPHTTIIPNDTQITSNTDRPFLKFLEKISESSLISKPVPFALPEVVTITPKPSFHYVTKLSMSTSELSTSTPFVETCKNINCKIIAPTTYSPSRSFLKSLLAPTLSNKTLFADSSNREFDTKIPKNTYTTTPEINSTSLSENTLEEVVVESITNPNPIAYFPTRTSRVNTALKSIVSFGGLQRQYTKCSNNETPTDKCKKPKKRVNNRGRGSSHYSNSAPEESYPVNRGTPPTRSRPTLKPSTSIVSKAAEFIDIYKYPPRRPESIYPQPQPDKTAAKCRKDVCLLPDCSCGGKEIPGDLPVGQVPQIVLLTFDDSVNDLNKGLYSDLFEKGRVNPNGCPIAATFYVSHEWTDYSQVQNLYSDGHELASHTVSHSFGEQFSQKKWTKEIAGQREILSAYGGVRLEDVRGMRAPFLSVGGNKMFKMLYDSNFTYDSSMPIYENKPPSWPYTLDYKLFHDCMIPPCPTRSYPGVWEVPMVMWQDLNGGRCSMGDACSNPPDADGVFKMLMKNFERHYTTSRAPFGLFYHAAWFTQPHHKEGFIQFLDTINAMNDVWLLTNWQAIQWVRDPTPSSRLNSFQPFGCDYPERPKRCNNPKVCNLWHKTGVRYMRTCQPCPDIYPWTGNTGIRSSRIDNEIEDNK